MICKQCNNEIDDRAVICVHCGAQTKNFKKHFGKKRFYQRWWFWVLFVLVALYIIGSLPGEDIPPVDYSTEPTSVTESILQETISDKENSKQEEPTESETIVDNPVKKTEKEVFCEKFSKESGYDFSVGEKLYNFLLDDLLAKEVYFVSRYESTLYSYVVSADGFSINVTLDEEKVHGASCGTYLMYDNGKVLYTVPDIANRSTKEYESQYYLIAKELVSGGLKFPSTAMFAPIYECKMQRNGDLAAVQGYVTSQNSFGSMIKSEYLVQFYLLDPESWTYEITYIRIDDQEEGKFVSFD